MLEEVTTTEGGKWLVVSEPENGELVEIVREFGLVREDAEFLLNNHHRPEVTVRDNYILILIEVPAFDRKTRVTTGVPVYVIVNDDRVVTVNFERLPALEKLRERLGVS